MSADDLAARVRRIEVMVSSAVDACDLTTRQRRAFRKILVELGALERDAHSFERAPPPPRTVFHAHLPRTMSVSEWADDAGGAVSLEGPGNLVVHPSRGAALEHATKLLPPLVLTPSEDRRPRRRR